MRIVDDVVIFKSTRSNYWKELTGRKPNTWRNISGEELIAYAVNVSEDGSMTACGKLVTRIGIELVGEHGQFFMRELTDVTVHDGVHIFSWRHKWQET